MPSSAKYIDTTTIMARGRDSGCPRCGGEVFHAEQMFSKDKKYHKVISLTSKKCICFKVNTYIDLILSIKLSIF